MKEPQLYGCSADYEPPTYMLYIGHIMLTILLYIFTGDTMPLYPSGVNIKNCKIVTKAGDKRTLVPTYT